MWWLRYLPLFLIMHALAAQAGFIGNLHNCVTGQQSAVPWPLATTPLQGNYEQKQAEVGGLHDATTNRKILAQIQVYTTLSDTKTKNGSMY